MTQTLPNDFYIICGDISLLGPGFAILRVTDSKVTVIDKGYLDNHYKSKEKGHGKILKEIASFFKDFIQRNNIIKSGLPVCCVREEQNCGSSPNFMTAMTIAKAIGITDVILDGYGLKWIPLNNATVKRLVSGRKKADKNIKQEVADALTDYVGQQEYQTNDESDAVSMGVAYLIMNGILKAHQIIE